MWTAPEESLCGIGSFLDNRLQFIYPKRDTQLTQNFGVTLHMCHNQLDILLNLTCVILSHMCHNRVLQQNSQPPLCHRISQKLKLTGENYPAQPMPDPPELQLPRTPSRVELPQQGVNRPDMPQPTQESTTPVTPRRSARPRVEPTWLRDFVH